MFYIYFFFAVERLALNVMIQTKEHFIGEKIEMIAIVYQ